MKVLLGICLLLAVNLFAQNPKFDSLNHLLRTERIDSNRLKYLNALTDLAFEQDFNLALQYAKQGTELAQKKQDRVWLPKFQEMQGRMHANLLHLDTALTLFNQAYQGYRAIDNKKGQATTCFKIAWVHKRRGSLENAMKFDLEALGLMEACKNTGGIANAYGRVSEDLARQGRNQEALEYAQKGILLCKKEHIEPELPFLLRFSGDAYLAMDQYQAAFDCYDEAIQRVNALHLGPSSLAEFVNCRGNAYKRLGNYNAAIVDYQNCLQLSREANSPQGQMVAIANLGEVHLLKGNYTEALRYQLKTIALQEKSGDNANLPENYRHASRIYEKLGNLSKALEFERKSRNMRDSVLNMQSDATISELRTKYETEKKEATIASQTLKIDQQTLIQELSIALILLLSVFAFFFYQNARSRKKINLAMGEKMAENELLLKEIHHRVKNNLEIISSLLALQSAQITDPNVKEAMLASQNRVQSIGIIHQKLYKNDTLSAIDMKDYLRNLSANILDTFDAQNRIDLAYALDDLELDIETAVPIGLIVNELLTNAFKYAFPEKKNGQVKIELRKTDANLIRLAVADNGIGKQSLTQGTGFGGQLIALLTKQLNGTLQEENQTGTRVQIDFKLKPVA